MMDVRIKKQASSMLPWAVILSLLVLLMGPRPSVQAPPTGIWCEYQQLPDELPFNFTQPVWWMEYFLFNATRNMVVEFKVYAGLQSDAYLSFFLGENYCPTWVIAKNYDGPDPISNYSIGTVSLTANLTEGNQYVLFVHMSGGNYTILACENQCEQICPNDCTGNNGVCNLNTGQCVCDFEVWQGNNCSQVWVNTTSNSTNVTSHHPKKIPFGNEAIFYSLVIAVPSILTLSCVIGVALFALHRHRTSESKKNSSLWRSRGDDHQPLLFEGSPPPGSPPPSAPAYDAGTATPGSNGAFSPAVDASEHTPGASRRSVGSNGSHVAQGSPLRSSSFGVYPYEPSAGPSNGSNGSSGVHGSNGAHGTNGGAYRRTGHNIQDDE